MIYLPPFAPASKRQGIFCLGELDTAFIGSRGKLPTPDGGSCAASSSSSAAGQMLYIYGVRAISRKAKSRSLFQSGSPQNPNSSSIQKTANALGAQISNTLSAIADEVRPAVLL